MIIKLRDNVQIEAKQWQKWGTGIVKVKRPIDMKEVGQIYCCRERYFLKNESSVKELFDGVWLLEFTLYDKGFILKMWRAISDWEFRNLYEEVKNE